METKHRQPCDCEICFYQKQERQKADLIFTKLGNIIRNCENIDEEVKQVLLQDIIDIREEIYDGN